jgi:hypothetical protein
VTAVYTGFQNGDGPGSLTSSPSCTSAVTALSVVGSYAGSNTCSGGTAANYSFVYVPANATVNQATLTVTASPSSTPYGTEPIVTPGFAGFQNSDGVGSLATLPSCASTVTFATGVGTYTGADTCSGGADADYTFSYVPANATVSPATLAVTASSGSNTYGSVPVVTPAYMGFQNGDGVGSLTTAPSCSSTVSFTTAAGTYTGANTCSGAAAPNYSFAYVAGDETVNPATLTVTASSTSTSYGTVPTVTAIYTGFQNGDAVGSLTTAPACASTVTATTGLGTYPGANTCSGGAATSYSFSYAPGDAAVTTAGTLTVVNGGGQAGRPEEGDQIIVTFSPVPALSSICSAWGASSYPALDDPSVVVTGTEPASGDDTLTVSDPNDCSGGVHFGTIDLGQRGYFNGTATFGGLSLTCLFGVFTSGCSSVQWNGVDTLAITLGLESTGQPTQLAQSFAVYTPDPALGLLGTISSGKEENF